MIHTIWVVCSLSLIFFIILHNPKAQSVSGQNQIFGSTRAGEENITKITWILTCLFFTLTIYISSVSSV